MLAKAKQIAAALLMLALLFALLYPSTFMRSKEGFGVGYPVIDPSLRMSGASLAQKNPKLFCYFQKTFDAALSDHKDMLLYRSCIGIKDPSRNFEQQMQEYINSLGFLVTKHMVQSNSFEAALAHIANNLDQVRRANGPAHKLRGPVYVLMFQAPYWRDFRTGISSDGAVIHVQPFNVAEYNHSPSVILRDVAENKPLHSMKSDDGVAMHFYMLFPLYDPAQKVRPMSPESEAQAIRDCVGYWMKHSTSENICKLKCPAHQGYVCGCLNTSKPYDATCLGPSDKKDRQKKEFINYGVLYRVHERNPEILDKFDPSANIEDECAVKV